jgi:hypothetical protein
MKPKAFISGGVFTWYTGPYPARIACSPVRWYTLYNFPVKGA